MEKAEFISIEDSEPDLILSFALSCERVGVKSLILMRTPLYENMLPTEERGVHATLQGHWHNDQNMLEKIQVNDSLVKITTTEGMCEVDISAIGKAEYKKMVKFVKRLNFDARFKVKMA